MKLLNIYKKYNRFELDIKELLIEDEIVGLLGHVGSGKTTLLKIIQGLVFSKLDVSNIDSKYMFESETLPQTTIRILTERIDNLSIDFDIDKCHGLVERFKLSLDDEINDLSEGQRKIMGFILTMSFNNDVLLLDEPLSKIDPYNRKLIINTIIEEKDNHNHIIIASHEIQDLERVIDSVVLLKDGKLLAYEEVERIELEHGNIKKWYSKHYKG